jgi:hypothetical protein
MPVPAAAARERVRWNVWRMLFVYLLIFGGFWLARDRWGIDGSGDHWHTMKHPFRIHVVNRSQTPVLVDALDEDGQRWSTFVIDRERDHIDVSAAAGSRIPIHVRPLTADGQGSRPGLIEWMPEAGKTLEVEITPSGQQVAKLRDGGFGEQGWIHVRSSHDLPIRVGHDMAPGNGGIYMPDPRQREKRSWVGAGVYSGYGGLICNAGQPATLAYSIPAVRHNAQDFDIEVNADGEMEVSIGRDGHVDAHPMSFGPTLLKWFQF